MFKTANHQTMDKKDLWLRLKAYYFNHLVPPHLWVKITAAFGGEDASTKAFADKIARKLQWKHRFALRAIREYKKFIYLGAVSDFVVTPSKIIDQVWHELSFLSANLYHTTNQILHCVQDDK